MHFAVSAANFTPKVTSPVRLQTQVWTFSKPLNTIQTAKMSIQATINNLIFKRTSTFALAVAGSVFFFERAFDVGTEYFFEKCNEGKLWKHIKQNYEQ